MIGVDQLSDRVGVPAELRSQRASQSSERGGAGGEDDASPAFRHRRSQAGSDERALAGSGWTDECEKMRPAELVPHRLDFDLASEKVLGVVTCEGLQSRIGSDIFAAV